MRKLIAFVLAMICVLSLVGCSNKEAMVWEWAQGLNQEGIICATPWSEDKIFEALDGAETLDLVMLLNKLTKDSFTENFNKNFGLIRRRIKSPNLWIEDMFIGKQTQTKVGIIYMKNIIEDELAKDVVSKLKKIDIDGILDSGNLKKYLVNKNSVFPTVITTERPDLVSMALLEGKCCIIVDNSPYVLVVPCFFVDLFNVCF